MNTHDFYYDLPQELIAQTPLQRRDGSRLMTLDRHTGAVGDHHFYDLPDFLRPGDCLILNDSRVLPARLLGQRLPGGGVPHHAQRPQRRGKPLDFPLPGQHQRGGADHQRGAAVAAALFGC